MEVLWDPRILPFLLVAVVWVWRSRLALRTLIRTPRLKPLAEKSGQPLPRVSILLPARNEEKNIRGCVESLKNQDHPDFEIIAINDRSTDGTEKILKDLGFQEIGPAKRKDPSSRLHYVNAPPTPEGWTGKNFAIHTGISEADGSWFLFTDADTRHEPQSLRAAMEHASSRDLALLTLLPRCLSGSFSEALVQPTAMGFLGLWFPIDKANDPKSKVHFGNGQYLLLQRRLYEKLGGHQAVRGEFLEDFALVKKAKEQRARLECAFGTELYATRMYDSLASIWRGWRRIYLHAFERNVLALFLRFLSVLFFSVVPFAAFFVLLIQNSIVRFSTPFIWGAALPVLILILFTAWRTYGLVKANRIAALLHPLAALLVAMILLDATFMAASRAETKWR